MASELYVETLKGLTSGANANKVIIPSGQTLDITDWSPPAGTVIGHHHHTFSTQQQSTSDTFADVGDSSFSYTPKSDNSYLYITVNAHINVFASSDTSAGGAFNVLVDGTAINEVGANAYEIFSGRPSSTEINEYARYIKQVRYTNTSTSAKTIKLNFRKYGGTRITFNLNSNFTTSITVLEIAG